MTWRKCHATRQLLPAVWAAHALGRSASANWTKISDFRIFLSMVLSIPLQLLTDHQTFNALRNTDPWKKIFLLSMPRPGSIRSCTQPFYQGRGFKTCCHGCTTHLSSGQTHNVGNATDTEHRPDSVSAGGW